MISLETQEVEIMCKEMDRYFQDAERAELFLGAGTAADARELAKSLGEMRTFLNEVLLYEEWRGNRSIQSIESVANRCAALEGRVQELRNSFSAQSSPRAA